MPEEKRGNPIPDAMGKCGFGILHAMFSNGAKTVFGTRLGAVVTLLVLALLSGILAFPKTQGVLGTPWAKGAVTAFALVCATVTVAALLRRRWLSALFHAGATAVAVGGLVTAFLAQTWQVELVDAPLAPRELRQRVVNGDTVTLKDFEIETYPNGMPKQFRTTLTFPEGDRTLAVNQPLRRDGITYYQMSYTQATDPMGHSWWATVLSLRYDPGAPIVFAGYGLLVLAALGLAVREALR